MSVFKILFLLMFFMTYLISVRVFGCVFRTRLGRETTECVYLFDRRRRETVVFSFYTPSRMKHNEI